MKVSILAAALVLATGTAADQCVNPCNPLCFELADKCSGSPQQPPPPWWQHRPEEGEGTDGADSVPRIERKSLGVTNLPRAWLKSLVGRV